MRPLCIYHGNCADGFGAAWVVRKAFEGNVDFHAGIYQSPPPDVAGRDVILVDFSYKRQIIEEMLKTATSILIIDHHKTAIEDLEPLKYSVQESFGMINFVFDTKHSGAMLTWLHYFGDIQPPQLIKHIEDRDLWKFEIDGTREIQACLFSYPYDFKIWDRLMNHLILHEMKQEGEAIERKHFKDIDELLRVTQRRMVIGGHNVPVANLPYTLSSDAGNKMAQGEPFACCYYDGPDGRNFSLRSKEDGLDVGDIAKQYGGGGHKHAAGFKVSYAKSAEFEINQ